MRHPDSGVLRPDADGVSMRRRFCAVLGPHLLQASHLGAVGGSHQGATSRHQPRFTSLHTHSG
eukprot:1594145-Pyramimonas_sp.AAC.1